MVDIRDRHFDRALAVRRAAVARFGRDQARAFKSGGRPAGRAVGARHARPVVGGRELERTARRLYAIPPLAGHSHLAGAVPPLRARYARSIRFLCIGYSRAAVLLPAGAIPQLAWHTGEYGVPVKDYILQSGNFLICAFVLLQLAIDDSRVGRWRSITGYIALAVLCPRQYRFCRDGRTALLVAPVLALWLGWREFRWKGLIGAALLGRGFRRGVVAMSPYLNARLKTSVEEMHAFEKSNALNSTSAHLQFLKESLMVCPSAPIIGHGTGSIAAQFRKAAAGKTGAAGIASVNPHDQILAIGIQLGLLGVAALHRHVGRALHAVSRRRLDRLDRNSVVVQNVVSSLVNSHLFDFTQAWLYIFGVGVAGGMALRERDLQDRRAGGAS